MCSFRAFLSLTLTTDQVTSHFRPDVDIKVTPTPFSGLRAIHLLSPPNMSQGASRRPEVILLSPSLEPEEMSSNATPNTLSSVQYGLTPGRPLQRSPLAIGDPLSELADGGSFTPPPPPDALEARPLMTNFIEHSNRSSPGDVREQQDAEPLFLASVTRGHQSRARRHRDSYSDHDLVLEGFGFNARGTRRLRTAHPLAQTGHPAANDFENVQYADMLDMLSDAAEEDTAPVPPSAPRLASGSGVSPPALHRRHVPPPPWVANLVRPPPRNAAPGESQADATDMNGGSGEFARWRREVVRRRSSSAQEQFEPDQVTSAT